jgi:alpha-amylase
MASTLHLLLVIDHRLPFGSSPEVFEAANARAWQPLAQELFRASGVRVALHYSGAVLDWLETNNYALLTNVREMVGRGQVEVVGGPRHDTVIHSVPSRDIQGQIKEHSKNIERLCGQRPRGLILPKGAWDPVIPRTLARTDMAYALLDQRLVQAGGHSAIDGWCITEREGQSMALFPTDERMRLFFPWGSPKQLFIELHKRMNSGQELLSVVIPALWLGMVPGSQRRCWEKRWVLALLRGLRSQSAWLKTVLPTGFLERQRPAARVYPCAGVPSEVSLSGMPEDAGILYESLQHTLSRGDDPVLNDASRWLLGAPWDAVLTRNDAANRLHKYSLRVSNQVARLQKRVERSLLPRDEWDALREQLYQGQGADYLDSRGGLRDARLRHFAWQALTTADCHARRLLGRLDRLQFKLMDVESEGEDAVEVVSPSYRVLIRPNAGGSISALQIWGMGNLVNTFARQRETWFRSLEQSTRLPALVQSEDSESPGVVIDADPTDVSELHDGSTPQPWPALPELPPLEGLSDAMLTRDKHRRLLFQDHFLSPQTTLANLVLGQYPEVGDFMDAPYQLIRAEREDQDDVVVTLAKDGLVSVGKHQRLVRIDKRYHFRAASDSIHLEYQISNRYQEPIQTRFAVELNINLDGQINSQRFMLMGSDRRRIGMKRVGSRGDVKQMSVVWEDLKFRLQISSSIPAEAFFFPVFSPIRHPYGYLHGYQNTCIFLVWPMEMWGAEHKLLELVVSTDKT